MVDALKASGVPVVNTEDTGDEVANAGLSRLDDDALILFTSGSTGAPKGVVHTHRSLRARWMSLRDHLGTEAFARTLCMLPTHFGHGLICNSLFPWLAGQDLFITPPFRPDIIMKMGAIIDEHQITFMSSVPSVWNLALKLAKPPQGGSLRRVHCGSAPLSAHTWEGIRKWTGTRQVCNAYGITETGSWVVGLNDADCEAEDGLIGQGWGAVIKILRNADTSAPLDSSGECAVGEAGYVWLNTPALMKGYFQRDDLTEKAVIDGWFMTGDIGFLDEKGRLVLRGRERDEINKGGMKIYPADVDAVVERFAQASDVCTFALDDELYGQVVGIAVVLTDQQDDTVRVLVLGGAGRAFCAGFDLDAMRAAKADPPGRGADSWRPGRRHTGRARVRRPGPPGARARPRAHPGSARAAALRGGLGHQRRQLVLGHRRGPREPAGAEAGA